ncbi:MAG: fasciclin domain-containing protein [Bacteroidales bacterium]|nr:fasciclin domain-containing protein [Bacteroidales bacterium]
MIGLIHWIILTAVITSCEPESHTTHWNDDQLLTIREYLDTNRNEYSKFYSLLEEAELLITLSAYNPYGEGYTLFLPTNEAIDRFIRENQHYDNFLELLKDTGFIDTLTRYHTINEKLHTDQFPFGALTDKTLSGDRLTTAFYANGDNQVIKVNNAAQIIHSNLKMTNGYVHVISDVLQQAEFSGYEWLQQQDDYSILAQAMELSGVKERLLWWDKYTILAEHDSIYHRNGINNIEDLINRVATPGIPYSDRANSFYQFAAYHILFGELYLNDLDWGKQEYWTLGNEPIIIDAKLDIYINPGVDTYGITISESGDTSVIDYIRPVWEDCNILTITGPFHSISDVLVTEPLPEADLSMD